MPGATGSSMGARGRVLHLRRAIGHGEEYRIAYIWCPACDDLHGLPIEGTGHPVWEFDGNLDAPTLSPSILTRYGPRGDEKDDRVCHSFVRAGRWEYLTDCTLELAGQTVPMRALPSWVVGEQPRLALPLPAPTGPGEGASGVPGPAPVGLTQCGGGPVPLHEGARPGSRTHAAAAQLPGSPAVGFPSAPFGRRTPGCSLRVP